MVGFTTCILFMMLAWFFPGGGGDNCGPAVPEMDKIKWVVFSSLHAFRLR